MRRSDKGFDRPAEVGNACFDRSGEKWLGLTNSHHELAHLHLWRTRCDNGARPHCCRWQADRTAIAWQPAGQRRQAHHVRLLALGLDFTCPLIYCASGVRHWAAYLTRARGIHMCLMAALRRSVPRRHIGCRQTRRPISVSAMDTSDSRRLTWARGDRMSVGAMTRLIASK